MFQYQNPHLNRKIRTIIPSKDSNLKILTEISGFTLDLHDQRYNPMIQTGIPGIKNESLISTLESQDPH